MLRPGGSLVVTDFHPAAVGRGWKRTFTDPDSGNTYVAPSYVDDAGVEQGVAAALLPPGPG